MTTGGGWQDQIGGIIPSVKLTFSAGSRILIPDSLNSFIKSPERFISHKAFNNNSIHLDNSIVPKLNVQPFILPISKDFIDILNSRLVLIYTGCSRLAKNLLQTVIKKYVFDPYCN